MLFIQWNRVRASLFSLLKVSGTPDLPPTAVEILVGLIRAECDAIMFQCNVGPRSSSHIFREELISEEGVPAGIFIRVLGEILDKPCSAGLSLDSMSNCVRVLFDSRVAVLHAFASHCPNPVETDSFCDPRLTLAEAWYFCINKLLIAAQSQGGFNDAVEKSELWHALRQLFIDTFVSTVGLLLYPSLGKTQDKRLNDPGMSFDGPHTLAIMDFFQAYFSLGPSMLQAAAMELLKVIPIDHAALQVFSNEADAAGIAIMGAALFRAAQGGLPPWAVECIPPVYAALYHALDKNPNSFGLVFEMSMRVKLMENHHFGGVQAGHLLSGRFFATMGDKAKHTFVTQAVELAKTDSTSGWKRLKASIKQACGGKKKDTDFKQRPASTKWDALDRV